ncbi:MAG: phospholipid/cholesterol/gamma-HCH transport system permease protein [Gammaproteobacteria bacterium]|jgi:phospholipid/cholesterol/gamma-HCH transport system permease protein
MKQIYFLPFLSEVVYNIFHLRRDKSISLRVLMRQILFTGFQALGLVSLIALMLGAIIIVEGYTLLGSVGQTEWIYKVLISTLVRDFGPFIVSFILIARSGTAIATELGNMVVNHEIDTLRVMGISPISYLVVPRVLGVALSLLLLIIYFVGIGFFGGFLVSNVFLSLSLVDFIDHLVLDLTLADLITMVLKAVTSGFFIGVLACYYGLSVRRTFTDVPQKVITAVGRTVIAVCLINILGFLGHFLLGSDL